MRWLLREVWGAMRLNRRRLFLTGIAVCWGMFILVVLLGTSAGLRTGVASSFHVNMPQLVSITANSTSLPWEGNPKNRKVELFLDDAVQLAASDIRRIAAVFPTMAQSCRVNYGKENVSLNVTGCEPGFLDAAYSRVLSGRDLNEFDMDGERNVIVINRLLGRQLFHDENPVGKIVRIYDIPFTVVGVCVNRFAEDITPMAYAPLPVMMTHFRPRGDIDAINVLADHLRTYHANDCLMTDLRNFIAELKNFSPKDNKAVIVNNPCDYMIIAYSVFDGLNVFIWVVGIAILIAGIVGVGNIMLIAVKERTREFGTRLAMGADDSDIIKLVILESLIIVFSFGYIGIMTGVLSIRLISAVVGDSIETFRDPYADFWSVIVCNIILAVAGVIAGYLPARQATRLKPVDALK